MKPSRSWRTYQLSSGSRIIGSSGSPAAIRAATSGTPAVTRYWCSIGTTGRSTPIIAPISRHQVPAALTMWRVRIASRPVRTTQAPEASCSIACTASWRRTSAPRERAPAASAFVASVGSTCPSYGSWIAPSSPSVRASGWTRASSAGVRMRNSWPRNAPSPRTWRNSAIRSAERVTRSAPHGWKPTDSPLCAGSTSRYRRTEAARISMTVGLCAKWVQSPAACQVEPAVSSSFSRSTTSRQPRAVRCQASDTPMMPPPTITTCVSVVTGCVLRLPLRCGHG